MVTACGGGNISKEDFPQEYARAVCAKIFDCCSAMEAQTIGMFLQFDDEDSCALQLEIAVVAGFREFDADIEAELVVYSGGTAQDCLDEVNDSTCTGILTDAATTCDDLFVGQLDNGETCTSNETCASGNCQNTRCENPPGLGEACEAACVDGLACVIDQCREIEPDGAACLSDEQCESGFCDEAGGAGGVCARSMTCDGVD